MGLFLGSLLHYDSLFFQIPAMQKRKKGDKQQSWHLQINDKDGKGSDASNT